MNEEDDHIIYKEPGHIPIRNFRFLTREETDEWLKKEEEKKMTTIVNVEQETGDMEEYGKPLIDWLDTEPRKYGARMIVPGGSIEFSFTPDGRTISAETRSAEIRGFYERIEKEKELKDKWEKAATHKAQENSELRKELDYQTKRRQEEISMSNKCGDERDDLRKQLDDALRGSEENAAWFDCLKIEYDKLQAKLEIAVKLLKNLKPILDKLGYGIGDTLAEIEKIGVNND